MSKRSILSCITVTRRINCTSPEPNNTYPADLSGKFGLLSSSVFYNEYSDTNIPLSGAYSILGRSAAVRKPSHFARAAGRSQLRFLIADPRQLRRTLGVRDDCERPAQFQPNPAHTSSSDGDNCTYYTHTFAVDRAMLLRQLRWQLSRQPALVVVAS